MLGLLYFADCLLTDRASVCSFRLLLCCPTIVDLSHLVVCLHVNVVACLYISRLL
jgi:hypothetical protein